METLLFYALPILTANIVYHFIVIPNDYFVRLKIPLDFDRTYRGNRIFGDNKTLRGLLLVTLLTAISAHLFSLIQPISTDTNPAVLGFIIGFLYMTGELPNSFLKRQCGIKPGTTSNGTYGLFFKYFDHVDSFLLAAIAVFLLEDIDIISMLLLVLTGIVLHVFINWTLRNYGYKTTKAEKQ